MDATSGMDSCARASDGRFVSDPGPCAGPDGSNDEPRSGISGIGAGGVSMMRGTGGGGSDMRVLAEDFGDDERFDLGGADLCLDSMTLSDGVSCSVEDAGTNSSKDVGGPGGSCSRNGRGLGVVFSGLGAFSGFLDGSDTGSVETRPNLWPGGIGGTGSSGDPLSSGSVSDALAAASFFREPTLSPRLKLPFR